MGKPLAEMSIESQGAGNRNEKRRANRSLPHLAQRRERVMNDF
ncbi:hypothetical protein ACNKHU_18560 [Shigella flexneri]